MAPPSRSGYQPLSQHVEEAEGTDIDADNNEEEALLPPPITTPEPSRGRMLRRNAPRSIDLKKLDNAFKRWTESIAQKVNLKRKKKVEDDSRKEIVHSVFEPVIVPSLSLPSQIKTLDHKPPMTQVEWDAIVNSVKQAILEGLHPKMITKGSSGSYFARAKVDGRPQTIGVFKPKDEEPYGRLNPKTTKWLHRKLRFIIPFGRACLIPNLSYISEAAASLLDQRLQLYIVPRTELVSLSSPAFFYDWIDRSNAKKGKILPEKIGSLQYFMHGFTDASDFLRQHPLPGRAITDTYDDSTHRTQNFSKRFLNAIKVICGRTGTEDGEYDDVDDARVLYDASEEPITKGFQWTEELQQSFREELEKLIILDYLMRNTDRGADNYMIRCCDADHDVAPVDTAPSRAMHSAMPQMSELRKDSRSATPSASAMQRVPSGPGRPAFTRKPHIHIAAIDNSLSFPHEHPKGWRSYTYGWLYLPVSVIGLPFSQKTRDHFLPILTSKQWWEDTTFQLRKLFAIDPGFHPHMFARQMAVMKGQAYNIVQSLKHVDEGPLELTRRQKALVWDDEVELTNDTWREELMSPSSPVRRRAPSIMSLPFRPRRRSHSFGAGDLPANPRRSSAEGSRPVPFASKVNKVHPGTTGVAVLEHMERLDAVEANLERLRGDVPEEEEVDVGESSSTRPLAIPPSGERSPSPPISPTTPSVHSPQSAPARMPIVQELVPVETIVEDEEEPEIAEEDLAALSKSTSQLEVSASRFHGRWTSTQEERPGFDLFSSGIVEPPKPRVGIVERLEFIDAKPLFSFC